MVSRARPATLDASMAGSYRFRMPQDLSSTLSMPLAELRGHWLEERCCGGAIRSPMWLHAVRWPGWLLSDLAMDHGCARCGTMPALALLASDRLGQPVTHRRIELADRFEEG